MERIMSWRSNLVAFAGLLVLGAPAGAAERGLCERLFVPEGYALTCSVEGDPAAGGWNLVVQPAEGTFAPLSELTIRPVDEPVADPAAWLEEQLTLDMSQFDATLNELLHSPDSPVADTPIVGQLESWRGVLRAAAGWPLAGCADPESVAGGETWRMECEWQLGPVKQLLALRLVDRDGERYAVKIRAMNEHRMRHLVAIANSF
jgi:hypothetical protein